MNTAKPSPPSFERRDGCVTTQRMVDAIFAACDEGLPDDVLASTRVFLADTLAVGVAGSFEPVSNAAFKAMQARSKTGDVRILGRSGARLPAYEALLVNGTQCHCLEWDALHEPAVVIALCVPTATLVAEAEMREVTLGETVRALAIGVEVAVFFGAAASDHPQFFRPSTAGLMGGAVALGLMRGFDKAQMLDLLGLAYSQVSGTMQAHWEGSEALPLQIGVAARAAHTAADLVEAGGTGPHDIIDGKFGYFNLIDKAEGAEPLFTRWGKPWKITEVAHKPFPAGRATQATLTALMDIEREHGLDFDAIDTITAHVPPLINLLVGRPYEAEMSSGYARLCLEFVAPQFVRRGAVDPRRFTAEHIGKTQAAEDATKVKVVVDDNPDPNAMSPQTIVVKMRDGREFTELVQIPYGSPDNPLDRAAQLAKARFCFEVAGFAGDADALMHTVLDGAPDAPMGPILDIVTNGSSI